MPSSPSSKSSEPEGPDGPEGPGGGGPWQLPRNTQQSWSWQQAGQSLPSQPTIHRPCPTCHSTKAQGRWHTRWGPAAWFWSNCCLWTARQHLPHQSIPCDANTGSLQVAQFAAERRGGSLRAPMRMASPSGLPTGTLSAPASCGQVAWQVTVAYRGKEAMDAEWAGPSPSGETFAPTASGTDFDRGLPGVQTVAPPRTTLRSAPW